MKATLPTEELLRVLHKSSSAIAKNPTAPIFSCLRIEVNGEHFYSRGYGENGSITSQTGCKSDSNAKSVSSFCIPAARIVGFVSCLQSPETTLTLDGDTLSLKSGNREARFKTLPQDEFPPMEAFNPKSKFTIDSETLAMGMKACASQSYQGTDRPNLRTVVIACQDGLIEASASNGRTGAIVNLGIADDSTEPFTALIPSDSIDRFQKDGGGDVLVEVGDAMLRVVTSRSSIFVRLSATSIPNVKVVFDQALANPVKASFSVGREEILSTMRAAIQLRGDNMMAASVRVEASLTGIALSGKYGDNGDFSDALMVKVKGEGVATINAALFTAWLSTLKDEVLRIEIRDEFTPIRVLPESGEAHDFILMPLRG